MIINFEGKLLKVDRIVLVIGRSVSCPCTT